MKLDFRTVEITALSLMLGFAITFLVTTFPIVFAWHIPYIDPVERPDLYSYYHGFYGSNPDFYYYGNPYFPFNPFGYGHYPDDGHDKHQVSLQDYMFSYYYYQQYNNPYQYNYNPYGYGYQQQQYNPYIYSQIPVQVDVRSTDPYIQVINTMPYFTASQSSIVTFQVIVINNSPNLMAFDYESVSYSAHYGKLNTPLRHSTYILTPYSSQQVAFEYYAPDSLGATSLITNDQVRIEFHPYVWVNPT